jgi:hypothetical protein
MSLVSTASSWRHHGHSIAITTIVANVLVGYKLIRDTSTLDMMIPVFMTMAPGGIAARDGFAMTLDGQLFWISLQTSILDMCIVAAQLVLGYMTAMTVLHSGIIFRRRRQLISNTPATQEDAVIQEEV